MGYGLDREFVPPNKPTFINDFVRNTTTSGFKKLTADYLFLNGNPRDAHAGGGLCSGDSGGPVFRGTDIVAVNSFAMANCENKSGHVRLDTSLVRTFLSQYLTLG